MPLDFTNHNHLWWKPKLTGVFRESNGWFKAWFNGRLVAYHSSRECCTEVLELYKRGEIK